MKKTDQIARELELSVSTAMENAKDWASPRVEAAVEWAVPRLQQSVDTASPKIQEGLKSAAHNLAGGVATVTPRIQDGLAQLAPKLHEAVDSATPRLHEALDKAAPVIANARDRVVVEYLPRLSDQIGLASEAVHRTLEGAPAHVDAVAQRLVDSGVIRNLQEQVQTASKQVNAAAAEASRAVTGQVAQPQKPKHRGLLIFGVIAAALAAGAAAWKASKPVEDPWKTPAPVTPATPAPVPATTVADVKDDTKETGTASDAGSVASPAADAADKPAADTADNKESADNKDTAEATGQAGEPSPKVATDAKTAVRNIAAGMNGEGKAK